MLPLFSSDSHVVEPPEVFNSLIPRFGDRTLRIVQNPPGRKGDYLKRVDDYYVSVGRLGIAGWRLDDPATERRMERGYAGFEPGLRDPIARLDQQDRDAVTGEVLYPSLHMFTFTLADREVTHALVRSHNDWLAGFCAQAPDRLVGAALLPLPDVEVAISELERVARLGYRTALIPCNPPAEMPYADPRYEPFWQAAEAAGRPLAMHIFVGSSHGMDIPKTWDPIQAFTLAQTAICLTLTQLICGGVAERHPRLRFVVAEFGIGWLAHFLRRLDRAAYKTPAAAAPDLTLQPSEYFHRQFYATFEDDEAGIETRRLIGVDNLLWGNDYPHHDAIWPNSQAILARICADVPEGERAKMLWGNGRRLYQLG